MPNKAEKAANGEGAMKTARFSTVFVWIAALFCGQIQLYGQVPETLSGAVNSQQHGEGGVLVSEKDVNSTQPDGSTALAWAAYRDDLKAAEALLAAGADPNIANVNGITPLALACGNRSAAMIAKLVQAGANPNSAQKWSGETAFMTCARTGSVEAVKMLLDAGANVDAREARQEQTALMWAVAQGHPQVVKLLVDRGADIRARTKSSGPVAVGTGFGDAASRFEVPLSQGGFTPLLFAARHGDIEAARILLDAGADVNEAAADGMSSLLIAADSGHEEFSLFLLERGANPNVADSNGMTPLHFALVRGLAVVRGVRFGAMADDVSYILRPTMPRLVKGLLDRGANPNARLARNLPRERNSYRPSIRTAGATPFLLAAAAGDVESMRLLVAAGADPLLATKDDNTTPLMAAAGGPWLEDRPPDEERRALEAVKLAVELGANLDEANARGMTALHGAAYAGASEIVQYLVSKGATVDAKDEFGQTPWTIASKGLRGDEDKVTRPATADVLVQLGASTLTVPLPPPPRPAGYVAPNQ
jgi:ankyrin repeat protein